jgi:hypothetical protein
LQGLFDQAVRRGWMKNAIAARPQPLLPEDAYLELWRRQKQVDAATLLHDAAFLINRLWSPETYMTLSMNLAEDELDYSSLEVVAAMLMLLCSWGVHLSETRRG